MSDKLFDMIVFARVVETGSLSGAARHLGLSLAVVSRTLARLEARLGVRLANRTTRTLSLTEEGSAPCRSPKKGRRFTSGACVFSPMLTRQR